MLENIIIIVIVAAIISAIVYYLYKCKKRGDTCIGCPYAKQCKGHCGGSCHTDSGQSQTKE